MAREFLGRVVVFDKEGNEIYCYDEITKAIYIIYEKTYKVQCLLPYEVIFSHINFSEKGIVGIIKKKNYLIIIPAKSNNMWMIYDMNNSCIRTVKVISEDYSINEIVKMTNSVAIIPKFFNDHIDIVSLEKFTTKKISTKINGIIKNSHYIFGSTFTKDKELVFPVVGSEYICVIKKGKFKYYRLPFKVLSVDKKGDICVCLPENDNYFYVIDLKTGEGKNIKCPSNDECEKRRIIICNSRVFMCPERGKEILVYDLDTHSFVVCCFSGDYFVGRSYYNVNCSYWTYYMSKGKITFLPLRYRFSTILVKHLKAEEKILNFSNEETEKCFYYSLRNIVMTNENNTIKKEERFGDLIDYLDFVSRS